MKKLLTISALLVFTLTAWSQNYQIVNMDRGNVRTLLNVMADTLQWEGHIIYKDSVHYVQVQGDSARFKPLGSDVWSEWIGGSGFYNEDIDRWVITGYGSGLEDYVARFMDDSTITIGSAIDDSTLFKVFRPFYLTDIDSLGVGNFLLRETATGLVVERTLDQVKDTLLFNSGTLNGTKDYLARWEEDTVLSIGATRDDSVRVSIGGNFADYTKLSVFQDSAYETAPGIESSIGQYLEINPTMTLGSSTKVIGYDLVASPQLSDTTFGFRANYSSINPAPGSVVYGIWSKVDNATNPYAFYGAGGRIYNKDSVGVNAEDPTALLDINGVSRFRDKTVHNTLPLATQADSFKVYVDDQDTTSYRWSTLKTGNTIIIVDPEVDTVFLKGTEDYVTRWETDSTVSIGTARDDSLHFAINTAPATDNTLKVLSLTDTTAIFAHNQYSLGASGQAAIVGLSNGGGVGDVGLQGRAEGNGVINIGVGGIAKNGSGNNTGGWFSGTTYGVYSYQGKNFLEDTLVLNTAPESNGDFLLRDASNNVVIKTLADVQDTLGVLSYTHTAQSQGSGAIIRLTDSDGTNDDIYLNEGAGMTITQNNDSTITLASSGGGETYSIQYVTDPNGAWMKLLGDGGTKDSVLLQEGTGISVNYVSEDTVSIVYSGTGGTTYTHEAVADANGAIIRLTGSDASTDDILLNQGANMTITQDDAGQITLASSGSGESYSLSYVADGSNVWIKLLGDGGTKDSLLVKQGANMTFTLDTDTLEIASTGGDLDLDSSPNNVSWDGITTTLEAGENLSFGDLVYLSGNGIVSKANAGDISTAYARYMALESITSGNSGSFLMYGFVRDDTWSSLSLTAGSGVFLSLVSGEFTGTPPSNSGDIVLYIGVMVTSTTLDFRPEMSNVEVQ